MANSTIIGAGAIIQLSISSVLTSIVNVKSIGTPEQSATIIDATVLASTAHTKEKIGGFLDSGQCTMEGTYDKTAYGYIFGALGLISVWRITLSNGSRFDFAAIPSKLSAPNPLDEAVGMNWTIDITGPVVFTP